MTTNQPCVATRVSLWPKNEPSWWVRHSVTVLTLNYSLVYIIRLFFRLSPLLHCPLRSLCSITLLFKFPYFVTSFVCSKLLDSLLIFPPPTPLFSFLPSPSIPLCFSPPQISCSPLCRLSRNAGLLMTSLRFVSQLAPTAVDYLNISIQRRRHLRDSPRPLLFDLDAQTPCDVTRAWILTSARMPQPALSFSTRKKITVSPFNSRRCQSCLKYWWLVGTVEGCVWDLQIVAASS